MAYIRTNWENNKTQLNATNMNNIEDGVEQALNAIPSITQITGSSTTEVISQDGTTKAIDSAKTVCNSYTDAKAASVTTTCNQYTDTKIAEAITTALNTAV